MNDVLPDRLDSGDLLTSSTGFVYTVARTSKKDSDGEPLYRLVTPKGIKLDKLWSRDELQEAGAVLQEKENDGKATREVQPEPAGSAGGVSSLPPQTDG